MRGSLLFWLLPVTALAIMMFSVLLLRTSRSCVSEPREPPSSLAVNVSGNDSLPSALPAPKEYPDRLFDPPRAAVCLVGGARSFDETFNSTVHNLLGGLVADWPSSRGRWGVDVFAYVMVADEPYRKKVAGLLASLPGLASMRVDAFGHDLQALGKLLPAADVLLPFLSGNRLVNSDLVVRQSMLGNYLNYGECFRAIEARERSAGRRYQKIVRTRPDFQWTFPHPPLGLLDEADGSALFVQDAEHYGGINDRHVVFPRSLAPEMLGMFSLLADGEPYRRLRFLLDCPEAGCDPEALQRLLARQLNVTALGFPPVAYLLESGNRDGLGNGFASRNSAVGGARYPKEREAVELAMTELQDGWAEAWRRKGTNLFKSLN
ncbi:hypothetical protein DFJ74DRAFT_419234 [Hyaloraphidium curvatum]|nr:hypothetical protein DFJ74DRAFT_419234 [Hyaloraphidium curvatum]